MADPRGDGLFHDRDAAARAWRHGRGRHDAAHARGDPQAHELDSIDGLDPLDPLDSLDPLAPADSRFASAPDATPLVHPATPLHIDGRPAHVETTSQAAAGAGIGGSLGAVLGALAAAVLMVGTSLAIPGLGWVLSGPMAAALAGAGAGAVVGGVIGALVGLVLKQERLHRGPTAGWDQPASRWQDRSPPGTLH